MCTVSFLPTARGFYLGMNRDEKRSRGEALPPAVVKIGDNRAIYPREPAGGTWISVNETGICLALINWHRIDREPTASIRSRGQIIPELAGASCTDDIADGLKNLTLPDFRPFRLIAIAPDELILTEWRWNLDALQTRRYPWETQHWFSSGFDELEAEKQRREVCREWGRRSSARGPLALRRLHRSHDPQQGPFSICMHRSEAVTLSYTEVAVGPRLITMRYFNGPPCQAGAPATTRLRTRNLQTL